MSDEVNGHTLVEGSMVTLTFEDGALSATAGCNTMSASATWDDGTLSVAGELATTMMACPEDLQAQDDWLADLLGSSPSLTLAGDTLTIGDDTSGMVLNERADLPLEGTAWTLDGLVSTSAASTVPEGVEASVTIEPDGTRMSVAAGCNTGSASITVEPSADASAGTIVVDPMATTRMACPDDAMGVEAQVLAVLQGPVGYVIEGTTLTLTKGDTGLVFTGARSV